MDRGTILKMLNNEVEMYKNMGNISKTIILIQLDFYRREQLIKEQEYVDIISRIEKTT